MTAYRATTVLPPLVQQAQALAAQLQFPHSSTVEVGRPLHLLVRHIQRGVIGEIGTGCGVGAAWIVSALAPQSTFVTVELDPARAGAGRTFFTVFPNVHVLEGDWHALLAYAPFELLFVDGGSAKQYEPDVVLAALAPGGLVVLDDLTPEEHWPAAWHGRPDPVRTFCLNDERITATEIRVTATSAVILATVCR